MNLGPRHTADRTVVLTVIVAVIGVIPSSVKEAGDAEQVERGGRWLQVNVTLPLNPFCGVTVTV